jgi:dTDP-glucose 4,6-dehydratase
MTTEPKQIVVVTGACGFLGLRVCRRLAAEGVQIVAFDLDTYAAVNMPEVVGMLSDVVFHHADVASPRAWRDLDRRLSFLGFGQPVAVLHLAAETHVDRSLGRVPTTLAVEGDDGIDDALDRFWRTNAIGTARVARWCAANAVRLIHVSTDEVLGDRWVSVINGGGRIAHEIDIADVNSPAYPPGSPYAASKIAAEAAVLAEVRCAGLDAVIVRPTNLYGPGQAPDKLIPVAVRKLCSNELVPLYGDGKQIREWVHVEDVARLLVHLALEATDVSLLPTSAKCGIVHAGSAQRGSNRLVVGTLATRCEERGLRHPGTDRTTFVRDRPGHDFAYGLDSSLTLAECGWKAARAFLSERDLDELIDAYGGTG